MMTPPDDWIASAETAVLQIDSVYGDFKGRTVADLGCGTVRLPSELHSHLPVWFEQHRCQPTSVCHHNISYM